MASGGLRHHAYGLTIDSDIELWPDTADDSPDGPLVRVRVRRAGARTSSGRRFEVAAKCSYLDWAGIGTLCVSRGELIELWPEQGQGAHALALAVAGPGLAMLLQQRGHVVLHGSSVEREGDLVCLAGASGAGKSTLALALRSKGYLPWSDGMTAVYFDGPVLRAVPGPPTAKLLPDAACALGFKLEALREVSPNHVKVYAPVQRGRAEGSRPRLRRIFLVDSLTPPQVSELGGAAQLVGVLKNFFLADCVDSLSFDSIFEQCRRVVSSVPVSALFRGRTLEDLPRAVDALNDACGWTTAVDGALRDAGN